jgi:hypothetical protein
LSGSFKTHDQYGSEIVFSAEREEGPIAEMTVIKKIIYAKVLN